MSSVQKQQIEQLKKTQKDLTNRFELFQKQMLEQLCDITDKFDLCLAQKIRNQNDINQTQLILNKLQALDDEISLLKEDFKKSDSQIIQEEFEIAQQSFEEDVNKQEQNYQSICQINKKLLDNDQLFKENNNRIDTKIKTIQNKLGQKLLQGGYSTISEMLNALFIQQQHNIQHLQQLDLLLGQEPTNNLTITETLKQNQNYLNDFAEKLEQTKLEFEKQFDMIENKIPKFIIDLYALAQKLEQYKLFRELIVGQYDKYQRDRNTFIYTKDNITVGIEDHSVYIEQNNSKTFDIRYVYNIQQNGTQIFYDYSPRIQKRYFQTDLPTDGIIGGGKYNEPIFETIEKQTIKNVRCNNCIFRGQFRFEHCELTNCQIIGIPKADQKLKPTVQFVNDSELTKCRITDEIGDIPQYFDSLYFQACNITKCQIESVHGILIDAFDYQQQYNDLKYIKESTIKLNADAIGSDSEYKKITIQGDKNNFGLQLENTKITVIDSSKSEKAAQIIFTGTRIFLKDCNIEIVDEKGQITTTGRFQYQFTTTEYSGSIQDSIIKVYNFEMSCVNTTGPYRFHIVSSNIITHSQLVSNSYDVSTCIIFNL